MNICTVKYIRLMKKHLKCGFSTKQKLVKRFKSALSNYLDDNPDATMEMLCADFGSPDEMASSMMRDLPAHEQDAYRKQNRLYRLLVGIILTLLLCFSMCVFFLKQKPIVSHVEITPYAETTTAPTSLPIE